MQTIDIDDATTLKSPDDGATWWLYRSAFGYTRCVAVFSSTEAEARERASTVTPYDRQQINRMIDRHLDAGRIENGWPCVANPINPATGRPVRAR